MLIFKLLFVSSLFASPQQTTTSRVQMSEEEVETKDLQKWDLFAELTFENKQRNLSEQNQEATTGVQNFSLGMNYYFLEDLSGTFELLGQQSQEETDVSLGQVMLTYRLPFMKRIHLKLGNMYYGYGALTGLEGTLVRRPDYYSDLLVSRRGIDLGAEVGYQFFENLPLTLSYSYFLGRTYRAGDNNVQVAEVDPQYLTLTYDPSFMTVQAVMLNRQYKERPQFRGYGLVVKSQLFKFWRERLQFSAMSEVWQLNYSRIDGFERQGDTRMVSTYVEFFRVFHRGIWAQEDWTSPSSPKVSSNFYLNGFGVRLNKHFLIEYQNTKTRESQPALSLTTANEDSWRILFQL